MILDNQKFEILDSKNKFTVADSFVVRSNKLGTANGEAKLYLGNENADTWSFFGSKGFSINCILLREDLLKYLQETRSEYEMPSQKYKAIGDFPKLWSSRLKTIQSLDKILSFTLTHQSQIKGPRVYAKSNDFAYKIIRELSLPNITYLSAIKLLNLNREVSYYFRLFIDYGNNSANPNLLDSKLKEIKDFDDFDDKTKLTITKSRQGQGKYRENLLKECPFCPVTLISDERLLIASHIKPWHLSEGKELYDPKNGFMFTPSVDHLFDRGFITFSNEKSLIASNWISPVALGKLGVYPNKNYPYLPVDGRTEYLDFHRKNIFKN
jgi:putative restriction endonuclease